MKFAVVDGCPCPASIAPYIYLVLRGAGQTASSIYRGENAKALLHRFGKHTQAEVHETMPSISNPPLRSEHELRADGSANPGPPGRRLKEWEQGVDSGTNSSHDKRAINTSAARFGWKTRHPYSRGVEGHHWCFAEEPKPRGLKQRAQIVALRRKLVAAAR